MFNYLLLKVKSRLVIYEIDMEGIKVECYLNGKHYFNLSCKHNFDLQYMPVTFYNRGMSNIEHDHLK